MSKQEPVIHASGMNDEELHSWISGKAQSLRLLHSLTAEKAALEEQLSQINKRIDAVSADARLDILRIN